MCDAHAWSADCQRAELSTEQIGREAQLVLAPNNRSDSLLSLRCANFWNHNQLIDDNADFRLLSHLHPWQRRAENAPQE